MDTDTGKRTAWEKRAAEKHDIDLERGRGFFERVWQEPGASQSFEEFDACVEYAWPFWEASREQAMQSMSYVISGEKDRQSEAQGSELPVKSSVELDERTGARISAFSQYLAKIAACDKRVMRLRGRVCGGVTRTMSREEALRFLEAHSMKGARVIVGAADTLPWPDGSVSGRHFRVQEGSVLEDLRDVAAYLKKHYPWSVDQAANFILCGVILSAGVIIGGREVSVNKGVAAHKYNRTTVKLEIDSWASADEVRKAYLQVRHKAHNDSWLSGGPPRKHPAPRNLEVFRFVVDQSEVQVISAEQHLGRLELPPWRDMLKDWNGQLSNDDPWRYSDVRNFQRDFHRAQLAVIGTNQGLPGVPGMPMTAAELAEYGRRFVEAIRGRNRGRVQDTAR